MSPVLLLPRYLTIILFLTLMNCCWSPALGWAAGLTLSWVDNATNETGFKIDRKVGNTGTYAPYTNVGANVTTYIDGNVTAGVDYCYRVQAYNGSMTSSYSNEACESIPAPTPTNLPLSVSIVGQGTVTSGSPGISCLPTCRKDFPPGTQVSLAPAPSSGWRFTGWSGSCNGTTTPCVLTINQAKNVTATFTRTTTGGGGGTPTPVVIGTFRDGSWFYDKNANLRWEGCAGDRCLVFGQPGDLPVVGSWLSATRKQIGVFRNGVWYLDSNNDQRFNGCGSGDTCLPFGLAGDLPVVGDWNGDRKTEIGVFRNGQWYLDANGNGRLDGCGRGDVCRTFGVAGDQPVAGDWNGDGKADIGIFRKGTWQLDSNNNGAFDGCVQDKCLSWGSAGSRPLVGDWSGNGQSKIGIYHRGAWQLDLDGDYRFEGCAVDKCFGFGTTTHIPVPQ